MSIFALPEFIPQSFDELSELGTDPAMACLLALSFGIGLWAALNFIRSVYPVARAVARWVFPFIRATGELAGDQVRAALAKSMELQVELIFKWAKWYGHRKDSVWYMVLCALTVSTTATIAIRVPVVRLLAVFLIPLSSVTFAIFGWRVRGNKCTLSRFIRSFYVPTGGYTLTASLGALAVKLLDLFPR